MAAASPVLVLLGHTDVVPPGPARPGPAIRSCPTIRDGVLYGRGAADMKGSVAAFVVALEQFVAAHPRSCRHRRPAADFGRGRRCHRWRAPRRRRLPRARPGASTGASPANPRPRTSSATCCASAVAARLSATLTVKGVQGHVAYPDKARNPIHQAMPALAELAARRWDEGYETFPPTSLQVSNFNAGTGANNVIPGEAAGAVQPALQPALECSAAGKRRSAPCSTGMAWNTTCTGIAAASRSIRPKAACAPWRARCWANSPAWRPRKAPAAALPMRVSSRRWARNASRWVRSTPASTRWTRTCPWPIWRRCRRCTGRLIERLLLA